MSCSAPCKKRSARRTPDAGRAVMAGGGDALAVGEERYVHNRGGMAFVFAQLLAGRHVPDAHRLIVETAGDNAFIVRRERGAIGTRRCDPLELRARPDVPDAHGVVQS